MNGIIGLAIKNKHTTGSAFAFGGIKILGQIAGRWAPNHIEDIRFTCDCLEALAVLYMGVSAGDAAKSATKDEVKTVAEAVRTGNTSMLKKADLPAPTTPDTLPKP